MTAVDDRPQTRDHAQMLPEDFEALASNAARTVEGIRLELLGGKVGVKAVPDGTHDEIIGWLQDICAQSGRGLRLYGNRNLKVETYRSGRAIPDGVLAPRGTFVGAKEWAEPDDVLMAVEVTSYDADTHQRDRVEKPRAYAETGIPVYLLVDRESRELVVHSEPEDGKYVRMLTVAFGAPVTLPDPVGIDLDTQQLLDWARAEQF